VIGEEVKIKPAMVIELIRIDFVQDVIYYAYAFYTGLLKEQNLRTSGSGWFEALGNLAHYCMAVAAMVMGT
jgi:protein SMG6